MADSQQSKPDTRRRRLIIEFELPSFYCDDIPELLDEFGGDFGDTRGEQILHEIIGQVNFAALTMQIIGEKDGSVVTVAALPRDARIEDVEPNKDNYDEWVDRLVADATERRVEEAYDKGYDEGVADGKSEAGLLPPPRNSVGELRP